MTMQQLNTEILKLLQRTDKDQERFFEQLEKFYLDYGKIAVNKWRCPDASGNSLLHELVEKNFDQVIERLLQKFGFDLEIRRRSDGLTPIQLAQKSRKPKIVDILKKFGAADIPEEDVSSWVSPDDREKAMNIVWVDLEMTALVDPEIIECAVIITDKDLTELDRGNWVIHFDQEELDKLGEWQQETFKDRDQGGNGLFTEAVQSPLTREEVENDLLDIIKKHCPEQKCPLAGSSIHTDKAVLKSCMPKVDAYLHYRIIDVSSFQAIMRRWAPWMETKIMKRLARKGQETVAHRAMDDIEWSIAFMKQFRPLLTNEGQSNDVRQKPRSNNVQKRSSSASSPHSNPRANQNHAYADRRDLHGDERRLLARLDQEKAINVKNLRLTKEFQKIYDANPHLREIFLNREQVYKYPGAFTRDNRILKSVATAGASNNSFETRKYSTTEYWGQRKLFITELEFLTNYALDAEYTVIYAGAAPGIYMEHLSGLFPNLKFILIDSSKFAVQKTSQIDIIQEAFSDELAKRCATTHKNILFICNVHTYNNEGTYRDDAEQDMMNQLFWLNTLKPVVSLLNFRVPSQTAAFSYVQGHQIIEPWASQRTTECRLIVKENPKLIDYYSDEFISNLRYFHNVTRVHYYEHGMDHIDTKGLDHCYDCRAEIFIIQEYLKKIKPNLNSKELAKKTGTMSHEITEAVYDRNRSSCVQGMRTLDIIPKKDGP